MENNARNERLRRDLETLNKLRACSSIFDFETTGDPPDRYKLSFRGKGIARVKSPSHEIDFIELHQIDMRLPYSYPKMSPDIRWITPILHPNVSFSGFIQLADVALPWDETVTLDAVCERLWDVARFAFTNLEHVTNFSAKNWFEKAERIELPVDKRILRDKMPSSGVNVIRYQRHDRQGTAISRGDDKEVLFIGEDTPLPPQLENQPPPRRTRPGNDDDVLYIE